MTTAKRRPPRERAATPRPEGWPPLSPEDRLSTYLDYRDTVPNYEELVALQGEAAARESLDYLFYFLGSSYGLLAEPEFQDLDWHLDPRDYLVYELFYHTKDLGEANLAGLGPELSDPRFLHMVDDALQRYYTPVMRQDVARRARQLARRLAGGSLGAQAEAVDLAAGDAGIDSLGISLLVESMRRALLQAVLDLPDQISRAWDERDRSLGQWLEALLRAGYERPAEDAILRLQQAGDAALPFVEHIYYDAAGVNGCDDYPFRAAMDVAAAIPSSQSLWLLSRLIVDCPLLATWASEQLAAQLPERACAYFRYLLTGPEPPASLAAAGLWVVVAAHCPAAFDLARASLAYRAEDAAQAETVQVAAWRALLALRDPAALPVLRAYLADEGASPAARSQLVEALRRQPELGWGELMEAQAAPVP